MPVGNMIRIMKYSRSLLLMLVKEKCLEKEDLNAFNCIVGLLLKMFSLQNLLYYVFPVNTINYIMRIMLNILRCRMTRRQKKYSSIITIIVLLALFLAGCSGGKSGGQEATEKNSESNSAVLGSERINIRYAQWSIASTGVLEQKIKEFNDTNKEKIHVNLMNIPLDRYMETVNMMNASGVAPDVFEINREWLNSYIIKNWVTDLSSVIDKDFLNRFPEWAVDASKNIVDNDGKIYSIPSSQITYRLIYNKDLFLDAGLNPDHPPKTLSQLEKYAKQISDAEKGRRKYGLAMPMGEVWVDMVQPMEAMNCYSGKYYYDFKKGIYDLTVYEPWLDAIWRLNENGGLFPGMETMKVNQALAQFADGNIGMMYASSWEVSALLRDYTITCDWGVALPPTMDESGAAKGKIKINSAGWNVIKSNTEYLDEAVKVWKYLYSKDYLGEQLKNACMIPVVNSISNINQSENLNTKFKAFLPGEKDSIYPNTPLPMEEWGRKNLYYDILTKSQKSSLLMEESSRLNSLLSAAVNSGFINFERFYSKSYNPLNPYNWTK